MNITLRQLQIFLAVAQCQNLSSAAESLFLTKGAVSQALLELEKQLGVKLFDRVHPHMHLNHEGAVLRPVADEILQRCQQAEALFSGAGDRYLQVGASKTIGNYIIPKLLKSFADEYGWMPRVHIANSGQLLEMISHFTLDVVLLEGESYYPDVQSEKWIVDAMVVLGHKGHPLSEGGPHAPAALKGEGWILREVNSGTREFFEHSLGTCIAPYTIVQSVESAEAVLGMVEQGLGLTFASKLIAELPDFSRRFSIIGLTQAFSRTFSLCYHGQKYHSPSMDQFLSYCRQWRPPT